MPRLLTSHHPRFTQDGLFFYALLGLVSFGSRVERFVLGGAMSARTRVRPSAAGATEPSAPGAEVDDVALAFLGALSLKSRISALIERMAAEAELPAQRVYQPPARSGLLK